MFRTLGSVGATRRASIPQTYKIYLEHGGGRRRSTVESARNAAAPAWPDGEPSPTVSIILAPAPPAAPARVHVMRRLLAEAAPWAA